MARGLKSIGRDRATLHPKHLEEFKNFAKALGYTILPNTNHPYNVLRLRSPHKREGTLFFYRSDKRMHITVPGGATTLMHLFLNMRHSTKMMGKPK